MRAAGWSAIGFCAWSCMWLQALAATSGDRIKHLPGLDTQPDFAQYSGYLDAGYGKHFHYWLVESESVGDEVPLVVWLNGGPGCSSMTGLLEENGPFWVNPDGRTLRTNNYSWNKLAHMLYIESPAGVGLSYSDDADYTRADDDKTCEDNYAALKSFMRKFPEHSGRDLYITGESYGGIYVPMLAAKVMDNPNMKFKGFAVGNGMLDNNMVMNGLVYYAYSHGFIGRAQWRQLEKNCCGGTNAFLKRCEFTANATKNSKCKALIDDVYSTCWTIGLNPYNYAAECEGGVPEVLPETLEDAWRIPGKLKFLHPGPLSFKSTSQEQILKKLKDWLLTEGVELETGSPCTNQTATATYLNSPSVREALHIPLDVEDFASCSAVVSLTYRKQYTTMRPAFNKVLSKGHRISVYNGDADLACNFLGDEWFVDSLQQPELEPYKAWYHYSEEKDKQVAGYVRQFKNINFVTVKGSGHFVPKDKPEPAYILFEKFLTGARF